MLRAILRGRFDVLVAVGAPSILAAQKATKTIPIVFVPPANHLGMNFEAFEVRVWEDVKPACRRTIMCMLLIAALAVIWNLLGGPTCVGVFLLSIIRPEIPPALASPQIARPCRTGIRLRSTLCPTACSCGVSPSSSAQVAGRVEK
jgi:hypothetical protein